MAVTGAAAQHSTLSCSCSSVASMSLQRHHDRSKHCPADLLTPCAMLELMSTVQADGLARTHHMAAVAPSAMARILPAVLPSET